MCLHFYFHHFQREGNIQRVDTSSLDWSFSCIYDLSSCETDVSANHCLLSQNPPRSPGFCCHISHRPWCLQGPNNPCGRRIYPFLITCGIVHCIGGRLLCSSYQLYIFEHHDWLNKVRPSPFYSGATRQPVDSQVIKSCSIWGLGV